MTNALDNRFEREYLLVCAARIAKRYPASSPAADVLSRWVACTDLRIGSVMQSHCANQFADDWKCLQKILDAAREGARCFEPDLLQKNIDLLAKNLDLNKSGADARVMTLLVRAAVDGPLHDLWTCRAFVPPSVLI